MLHLMGIMGTTYNIPAILSLVYERPEEGTDLPKHVGVMKNNAVKSVCSLYISLVL